MGSIMTDMKHNDAHAKYGEFLDFCMSELKINAVIIDLEPTSVDDWGHDHAEAYCGEGDAFGPLRVFEIEYIETLEADFTAFHKMIAHELTHVMQCLRGDVFRYDMPYEKQPHEIEAYAMQEVLWQKWLTKGYSN